MIDTLMRAVLWAEFDVLESLSRGFRPENKGLSVSDVLVAGSLVAVVTAIVWGVSRYYAQFDPKQRITSPRALFAELCHVHGLAWPQRQLLRRLAREQKLNPPAMLFVQPECFEPSRWSRALRARQRDLVQLRHRLFDDTTSAGGDTPADHSPADHTAS